MRKEIKIAMIMAFLLLSCATIGSVSAQPVVYDINDSSYSTYFNASGYITDTSIVSGDVLNCSGAINNKDMYIDRALNITSYAKTGKIVNGTITILPEGSGSNITDLVFNNTNHNGDVPGTIVLFGAENCTIADNTIVTNQEGDDSYGVHLVEASNNQITGNRITTIGDGTGTADGAAVDGSGEPGNGKFTYGVYLHTSCSNNVIDSNTIYTTGSSATVDWSDWLNGGVYPLIGAFIFEGSNNNALTNNNITTGYTQIGGVYDTILGVRVHKGSSGNNITGNNIITNGHSYGYGLEVVGSDGHVSSDNVVSGNNISTTADNTVHEIQSYANGLKVSGYTADTIVSGNDVSAVAPRFAYGVYLEDFTGDSVENVTVTGNKVYAQAYVNYVFELWLASGHTITNNTVTGFGNYSTGIGTALSNLNIITGNVITTYGDNSAPPITNVDAIPASNEGVKLYSSNNNIVDSNIIASSDVYAVNSYGSGNTVTNNYLYSNNGTNTGDNAVTGTGTIADNHSGIGVFNGRTHQIYSAIQEAIDAVNTINGDTLIVIANYTENVVLNKNLLLNGFEAIVNPLNAALPVFKITNDGSGSTIQRFTITGSTNSGIYIDNSIGNSILNNVVFGNDTTAWGICIVDSNGTNNITGNNITGCEEGINLYNTISAIITGNNVSNNIYDGIALTQSSNNTITGNSGSGNASGVRLNTSNGNLVSNNDLTGNVWAGISLVDSDFNEITGNVASDCQEGIYLYTSDNNTISGNTANNNQYDGIALADSNNNTVLNNLNIIGNESGIRIVGDSSGNQVLNNTVSSNTWSNISLDTAGNTTISGNTLTSSHVGVYLSGSSGNTLQDNTITGNDWDGVLFENSSNNNTVTENTVSDGGYGVRILSSTGNTVYRNNFVDNYVQAFDDSTNSWDDGTTGNYYNDWATTDPRPVDGGSSVDNYPSTTPF